MSQELLEKYIQTGNDTALRDLLHSNPELINTFSDDGSSWSCLFFRA